MSDRDWLIILNWNGCQDTLELLDGLRGVQAEVLLVDNGSTDATVDEVRKRFPEVRVLENGENLGYAGGNNRGIEYALARGAEVVGVLNNDTLADPKFLAPLVAAVRSDERLAVSPEVRYASDPAVPWFRGGVVDSRIGRPVHADTDKTDFLTGCCLVANATAWRMVGLFDERLFLIFEDNDWSWRARRCGVRLKVVDDSIVLHKVSRSFTGVAADIGTYYFSRNALVFAARHLGASAVIRATWFEVLRPAVRDVRQGRPGSATLRTLGLLAAAVGRRGRAGRLVSTLATRAARNNWEQAVSLQQDGSE